MGIRGGKKSLSNISFREHEKLEDPECWKGEYSQKLKGLYSEVDDATRGIQNRLFPV